MIADWRSLLFVPADAREMIAKAHTRGADAIILDLEDAVAPLAKPLARAGLGAAITLLTTQHVPILVRINATWRDVMADLDVAIVSGVSAVVAPKVRDAESVSVLSAMIAEFETGRDLPAGTIGIVALIEHPAALAVLQEIILVPRVVGLALGSEDFALALGVPPSPAILRPAAQAIAFAASTRRVAAIGLPCSLALYRDPAGYRAAADEARSFGMTGALCIHPDQVGPVNDAFAPDRAALAEASALLAAWDEAVAAGRSVAVFGGSMVDLPVAERARRLLGRG